MQFVDRTLRWQRQTLAGVLVASALLFNRGSYDVFNTTKAAVIVLGTIAIVAVGLLRVARTRRIGVPATRVWLAVAAFVAALVVATLVSPTSLWSVVGRAGRHTGLAMYVAYALLFAVAVRLYRAHSPAHLVKALLLGAVPVTVYGLAQSVGVEPFGWNQIEGGPQVFATFGNANFFSAWLGIVIPLAVWGALTRTWAVGWRLGSGALALLAMAACYASDSLQGLGAAILGALLVAGVWLWTGGGAVRRLRRPLLIGAAATAGLVGAAVASGPFASLRQGARASLDSRVPKWETALAMIRDRPFFGYGLDDYADWYNAYRPESVAAADGLRRTVDAPHNVPLDMAVSGGLLLFVAYLAVVAVVGWALVVGLRRLQGEERLLLAGFGGAWVAYQAQSLVSIDVPPLAVLHWVLAGVIVALGARPALRVWALPGAPPLPEAKRGRKRKAPAPTVPLVPAHPLVLGGLAVAVVAAAWVATLPARADTAAMRGIHAFAAGDTRLATDSYRRAADLAPYEPRYPAMLAGALNEMGFADRAYDAYLEAARRDPHGLAHVLNLARVAQATERSEAAADWYARALEIDPTTPEVLAEVGRFRLGHGEVAEANVLLERAVTLRGDEPDWWVALGHARSAEGDRRGARQAFERALQLEPGKQEATEGLQRLATAAPGLSPDARAVRG